MNYILAAAVLLGLIVSTKSGLYRGISYTSKLEVLTDMETGCQYLRSGSLQPRLDYTGLQVGCKPPNPSQD